MKAPGDDQHPLQHAKFSPIILIFLDTCLDANGALFQQPRRTGVDSVVDTLFLDKNIIDSQNVFDRSKIYSAV